MNTRYTKKELDNLAGPRDYPNQKKSKPASKKQEAWERGFEEYFDNLLKIDNPYDETSQRSLYLQWLTGWYDARQALMETLPKKYLKENTWEHF